MKVNELTEMIATGSCTAEDVAAQWRVRIEEAQHNNMVATVPPDRCTPDQQHPAPMQSTGSRCSRIDWLVACGRAQAEHDLLAKRQNKPARADPMATSWAGPPARPAHQPPQGSFDINRREQGSSRERKQRREAQAAAVAVQQSQDVRGISAAVSSIRNHQDGNRRTLQDCETLLDRETQLRRYISDMQGSHNSKLWHQHGKTGWASPKRCTKRCCDVVLRDSVLLFETLRVVQVGRRHVPHPPSRPQQPLDATATHHRSPQSSSRLTSASGDIPGPPRPSSEAAAAAAVAAVAPRHMMYLCSCRGRFPASSPMPPWSRTHCFGRGPTRRISTVESTGQAGPLRETPPHQPSMSCVKVLPASFRTCCAHQFARGL